ncbi:hypothetical protein AWV79_18475 [Cupriavidus sp. UYMMa02A]|jgi:predicted RNA-binding Zn-ribbon protein involved in translation (DUF1610 family)|nr:hypothetical protein AWV79_18475 [Cupriavidus sp. UYMMa02A]
MLPEPANCPLCSAAAERTRAAPRGYRYACPACGTFHISNTALGCRNDIPASARDDVRRLRAYGHTPTIEVSREGVRIVPGH